VKIGWPTSSVRCCKRDSSTAINLNPSAAKLTTAFLTMPLSAADFATARPVIGSVSAVGSLELHGVGISQVGTLFSGDSIRSHEKGYAQVLIGTDSRIELSEKTDVRVNRDARGVQIAMNSGLVGFMARTPLRIDLSPFEITASDDASGNVAIINPATAGVRVFNGKVTVRNLKTFESFVLTKGQEEVLGLKDGVHRPSLGQIASKDTETQRKAASRDFYSGFCLCLCVSVVNLTWIFPIFPMASPVTSKRSPQPAGRREPREGCHKRESCSLRRPVPTSHDSIAL
jgi:hypothetical protein